MTIMTITAMTIILMSRRHNEIADDDDDDNHGHSCYVGGLSCIKLEITIQTNGKLMLTVIIFGLTPGMAIKASNCWSVAICPRPVVRQAQFMIIDHRTKSWLAV